MSIADALSHNEGPDGLRRMLVGSAPQRALRRALRTLLNGQHRLGACRLRRARLKADRRLMAYYDVHICTGAKDRQLIRPVAVVWGNYQDGSPHGKLTDASAIEGEARDRGLLAPFQKLTADLPGSQMSIRISPLDLRFPQLVRACDPKHVRKVIAPIYAGTGRMVSPNGYSVTAIRYRPKLRHVLRYDPVNAPELGSIFAKLYHTSEDGNQVFCLTRRVQNWLLEHHGKELTCLRPLAFLAEDSVVLYAQVEGTPLSDKLRCPSESLAGHFKGAGGLLYALHQLPRGLAGALESHNFEAEIKKTSRASRFVSLLLPAMAVRIEALLHRAREIHDRLPHEEPTFVHNDFKAEHVWLTRDGLALIDFDSCVIGDPALDVGKFLADLQYWYSVNHLRGLRQAQQSFLEGYGSGTPAERLLRSRIYESVELVKLAGHRLHLRQHDWASQMRMLIECAEAVLRQLESDLGYRKKQLSISRQPGRTPKLQPPRDAQRNRPSASRGLN